MEALIVLAGLGATVLGAWLGSRRVMFTIAILLSAFCSWFFFTVGHEPLSRAITILGISHGFSFILSLVCVTLLPFVLSVFFLSKALKFLGLTSDDNSILTDTTSFSTVMDHIYGGGVTLLIYIILLSLFWEDSQ